MSNIKKLMVSAGGGAGLDVDEVFSTDLWKGTEVNDSIVNNIDLSGEGGLVWVKNRNTATWHTLIDTERGANKDISSNSTLNEETRTGYITGFNSDGYNKGTNAKVNNNNYNYCGWTWRKAPKFFDVVTYTGNGANRSISHSLGSEPGMIIIKRTDASESWIVYHRSLHPGGGSGLTAYFSSIELESSGEQFGGQRKWGAGTGEDHTASTFYVSNLGNINESGGTFVAYLFAHNNGDGGFGPDGDQDIIKCGSWTASSTAAVPVDLGFEPQWVLIKRASGTQDWLLWDTMRGMPVDTAQPYLRPNSGGAEGNDTYYLSPTPTGFTVRQNALGSNGDTYIYMAIRRGPLFPPEDADDVFAIDNRGSTEATNAGTSYYSGFPVDFTFGRNKDYTGGDTAVYDRLRGRKNLFTNLTNAEGTASYYLDSNQGFWGSTQSTNTSQYAWMWKRAPGFFDVVAYSGNQTIGRNVSHNLGVAPEMMWVKNRSSSSDNWPVYHKDLGTGYIFLNDYGSYNSGVYAWNNTHPTASSFTVHSNSQVNGSGFNYIAYLFATLPGISKVGSYTGTGSSSSQTIDCGFTSGARFVLIKNTSSVGWGWFYFDTERGITTTSNDGTIFLNATQEEYTEAYAIGHNVIEPDNSGFKMAGNNTATNKNGETYIFYAIA